MYPHKTSPPQICGLIIKVIIYYLSVSVGWKFESDCVRCYWLMVSLEGAERSELEDPLPRWLLT
jgi:hypothetical protein